MVAEKRIEADAYMTPMALAEAVCTWLLEVRGEKPRYILEPSAGDGAFVKAAKKVWPKARVTAVELRPACRRLLEEAGADDVVISPLLWFKPRKFDLVIGNPPFKRAESHIRYLHDKGFGGARISMLLRLSFLGSASRGHSFWPTHPLQALVPFAQRPTFIKGKNDNSEYAQFLWAPPLDPATASMSPPLIWRQKK